MAGGNREDSNELGSGKGKVNPMFAVSSAANGNFAVHYGTEPLLGFHTAEAFEGKHATLNNPASHAEVLVGLAKRQFEAWCQSFRDYVRHDRVQIDFFHGEALTFSHALQLRDAVTTDHAHTPMAYTKP